MFIYPLGVKLLPSCLSPPLPPFPSSLSPGPGTKEGGGDWGGGGPWGRNISLAKPEFSCLKLRKEEKTSLDLSPAKLMRSKGHLTKDGFEEIKQIKSGMNRGRDLHKTEGL